MTAVEVVWQNPHMAVQSWWVTFAIVPIVIAAIGLNWCASRRGVVELAATHAAAFLLACVYLVAYVVLLFTDVRPGTWSEWVRPVSLVAWVVVWCWPSWLSLKLNHKLHAAEQRIRELEADE